MNEKRLGEILRDSGVLTEADLQRALEAQRATGQRLGGTLLRLSMVDSRILARALGERYGVEGVDLGAIEPQPEALAKLDAEDALRYGAVPIAFEDGRLSIALADPTDRAAVARVEELAGSPLRLYVAPQSSIYQAIKERYGIGERLPQHQRLRRLVGQLRSTLREVEKLLDG